MTVRTDDVLTPEATAFLAELHQTFDGERRALLEARTLRRPPLDFLADTAAIRAGDWTVAPPPPALQDRRVEITGPTNPKMVINALNSGARGFMADFEDANSPTWHNMIDGQRTLAAAIRGTLTHSEKGKDYELKPPDERATLLVRPRGWHLPEAHHEVDGRPIAGALFDFGLFAFHNAQELLDRGAGPFFYVPKLESHKEARLWNDVFTLTETRLELPPGSIRATVLIETSPAAFEMDEILHELKDHSAGLNAGRWDYLFSLIKVHREDPSFLLPDRVKVTMTVPFMRAYTELLVKTCHRRGAHAMGGMSAVIPSRTDDAANKRAYEAVAADKRREAEAGYDGTWVAHPDSVAVARQEFDRVLGDRPNQVERQRDEVDVTTRDLLAVEPGAPTDAGLRGNINVAIQYLSSWLRGNGAAGIHGLMEDAATAEIARSQVWQWIHHGARVTDTGEPISPELVRRLEDEELEKIRSEIGDDEWFQREGRPQLCKQLFEQVALDGFPEFLTLPAYEELRKIEP